MQPLLLEQGEKLLKNLSLLTGGNEVEWEGVTFGKKGIQKLPIFFTEKAINTHYHLAQQKFMFPQTVMTCNCEANNFET